MAPKNEIIMSPLEHRLRNLGADFLIAFASLQGAQVLNTLARDYINLAMVSPQAATALHQAETLNTTDEIALGVTVVAIAFMVYNAARASMELVRRA
jgi:hypothetical protein